MKKQILSFVFLAFCAFSAFAQKPEARLIDEVGRIPCGDYMPRLDALYQAYSDSPGSKIYVLYYEGINQYDWDKKLEKTVTVPNKPVRGAALNQAKAIPLYLKKVRKLSSDQIVLIDGGFRDYFTISMWLVPAGAPPPEPTLTMDAKNVKFKSGKPERTPDLANCDRDYE